MSDLLAGSRIEIVASLMADVGLSFHDASISFDEMCCVISDIRKKNGVDSRVWETLSPIDSSMPADWRATLQIEIEERVRELALLREE